MPWNTCLDTTIRLLTAPEAKIKKKKKKMAAILDFNMAATFVSNTSNIKDL